MPLTATVRSKLQNLVPLLSSDVDGERLATTAAIGRILKANGLDWHDFAAALGEAPRQSPPPPQRAQEPALRERPGGDGYEIAGSDLVPLVAAIRQGAFYDAYADQFLTGLEDKASKFAVVWLTAKQAGFLVNLLARVQT